jgi:hypothetical protein
MPVVRQITSRMDATASILEIATMSAVKALSRFETGLGLVGVKSDPSSQISSSMRTSLGIDGPLPFRASRNWPLCSQRRTPRAISRNESGG